MLFATVLLLACTDNQLKVVNTEPTAEILVPEDGAAFVQGQDVLVLRGEVGDADQDERDLAITWISDADGTLGTDPPDDQGMALLELPALGLSTGEHTITLNVSDVRGLSASDQVTVTIVPPDEAPAVMITEPEEGATFWAGEAITLAGAASDARDAASSLTYEWESDSAGVVDSGLLSSEGETRYTTALEEGNHTFTLRVTDTEGNAAEASVSLVVLHVNEAPSAEITEPASGDGIGLGRTATFTGRVSDPEDAAADLAVRWRSDLDGELYVGVADSSGTTTFATADLTSGNHTITLEVTDTEGLTATAAIAFEVYERNTPPEPPEIAILPADPTTTDDLEVVIVAEAVDEDGDAVSYLYQWYRDSALMSGFDEATVGAARTGKHETWMVEVRAWDGVDESEPATAEVTIANTPPSITGAVISPSSPTVQDTLTCAPSGWSDADGDDAGYRWSWTVGGVEVGTESTLSDAFSRGDEVGCTLWPDDGDDLGDPVEAAAVTVVNTAPTPPVIRIDPAYPTGEQDLEVLVDTEAIDADGDALSTTWTWTRNGASTAWTTEVPASATTLDEVWTVTAQVSDGVESVDSETVGVRIWPGEGDLLVTEFHADPSAAADARGEFVEIWNATTFDLSLEDHTLEDYDYDCVDLSGLTIPAGGYVVICVEGDSAANGGITTCDVIATWDTGYTAGCNQLALSNSGDEIAIVNPAGTTDAVVYTSAWVDTGRSTALDPDRYDATENDSAGSWCAATSTLSGGDEATPGADNDGC